MLNGAIDSFAATDTGLVRLENEDSLLLIIPDHEVTLKEKGVLAVIADGVGGGNCGKTASSLAVSAIQEHYYASQLSDPLHALKESVLAANREIMSRASQDRSMAGMATTCTAFLLLGKDGFITHAGDSRAYLFRDGTLRQLTEDHTLVNKLLRDGLLTDEAAQKHPQRNVIVKALGSEEKLVPDASHLLLEENDIVLLCSDGLHGPVSDAEITSTLSRFPLQEAGNSLIALAKKGGGSDNITVILLRMSVQKGPGNNVTRPYHDTGRKKMSTAAIAIIVALLAGTLLYISVAYGLHRFAPPALIDLLKSKT